MDSNRRLLTISQQERQALRLLSRQPAGETSTEASEQHNKSIVSLTLNVGDSPSNSKDTEYTSKDDQKYERYDKSLRAGHNYVRAFVAWTNVMSYNNW